MIAVDTDILVHAHRPDSPFHERARSALESLADGTREWAVPWPCVHEFLAIVRIAAICLAHGVAEPWSADSDFARFPAPRARNAVVG